jgi:hypothetical protein
MKTISNLLKTKWQKACIEAVTYWKTAEFETPIEFFNHLILTNDKEKLKWVNWGIVRLMNKKQKVQYSIFAAEQVLPIFEKKYPNDKRPRLAIEAAKNYLKIPCKKTKNAAYAAYAIYAADAAAYDDVADVAYADNKMLIKILEFGINLIK